MSSLNGTSFVNDFVWEKMTPPSLLVLFFLSLLGLILTKLEKSVIPEIRKIQYLNFFLLGVYALLLVGRNVFKQYGIDSMETVVTDMLWTIRIFMCIFDLTSVCAWIITLLFLVYDHEIYEKVVSGAVSTFVAILTLSPMICFRLIHLLQHGSYQAHYIYPNIAAILFGSLIGVCCLIFFILFKIPEEKIMERGDDVDIKVFYYHTNSKRFYLTGFLYGFLKICISIIPLAWFGSDQVEIYSLISFTTFIMILPLKDKSTRKDLAFCCRKNSVYQQNPDNHDNQLRNIEDRNNGPDIELQQAYFERQQRWAMNHQRFENNGSPPSNFLPPT